MTDRRSFILGAGASLTLAPSLAGCANLPAPAVLDTGASPLSLDALFTLGVASGDPLSDGFVIWTRFAPDPLSPEPVLQQTVPVTWQVAEDERFSNVVAQGRKLARPDWAHSVHVEVSGLRPARQYHYRFLADGQVSPPGRARTAPALGAPTDRVRFGLASCQHFEQGFFTAYDDAVERDLDYMLHLGDYIYEASWGPQVRRQAVAEAMTLSDYRLLHAQYKTDAALQRAHAAMPWLMIWDDHEVVNDYAGLNDENYMDPARVRQRRAAAYQSYYEHMPVRLRSRPRGPEGAFMRLHDYSQWGDLMTTALVDTRQHRADQACQTPDDGGGQVVTCAELRDRSRSIFGAEQERWLMPSFARSGATWEVLAQPTLFSRLNQTTRDGVPGSWNDGWDGYPASRQMILDAVAQRRPENFVSLGGDMHSWWQADLKLDYDDPDSQTVGTEFVATSVTAHSYAYQRFTRMLPDNPHIHFFDDRKRGYAVVEATPAAMQVDFLEASSVYEPGAPLARRKRFVIESGQPGANEA